MPENTEPADEQTLLPCPFCGSGLVEPMDDGAFAWVHCMACGAEGAATNAGGDAPEAIAAWNTRTTPPATREGMDDEYATILRPRLLSLALWCERGGSNPTDGEAVRDAVAEIDRLRASETRASSPVPAEREK